MRIIIFFTAILFISCSQENNKNKEVQNEIVNLKEQINSKILFLEKAYKKRPVSRTGFYLENANEVTTKMYKLISKINNVKIENEDIKQSLNDFPRSA